MEDKIHHSVKDRIGDSSLLPKHPADPDEVPNPHQGVSKSFRV